MEPASQYCPVAVATEILADRWTPLILREFIVGAHSFGEVHNGIPHISRTMLSSRLKQLTANGIIERTGDVPGRPYYRLTPAGRDLEPLILGFGEWAIRWAYFGDPVDEQLDNTNLMWRFQRGIVHEQVPPQRVVVEFAINCPNGAMERIWLVIEPEEVETCLKPPAFDVDIEVRTTSRELHRIWLGRTTITNALRERTLELEGPSSLRRGFPHWFAFSPFANSVQRALSLEESRDASVIAGRSR